MNSFDLINMGMKNLLRRKMRTILTALGIVIGTVSIVVMVSLGMGMTKQMDNMVEDMGDVTIIEVMPSYDGTSGVMNNDGGYIIPVEDIEKIGEMQHVEALTPQLKQSVKLISGRYEGNYLEIIGIDMSVAEKFGIVIGEGRLPDENDRAAIVVGSDVPFRITDSNSSSSGGKNSKFSSMMSSFRGGGRSKTTEIQEPEEPDVNMLEDRLYYTFDTSYGNSNSGNSKLEKIQCTGFIDSEDWQIKSSIYMELSVLEDLKMKYEKKTGQYKKEQYEGYDSIKVKINDVDKVKEVQEKIEAMGYKVNGMIDMVESLTSQSQTTQMIFGGIGAISLLVAAIGITNTMVMAIHERRKEIGVMKVIGASLKDIKKLFLLESASIGFIGGGLGVILSYIISGTINKFASGIGLVGKLASQGTEISIIPAWLAITALVFTAFIGLLSGYIPAIKAMKLSALEAIKNE